MSDSKEEDREPSESEELSSMDPGDAAAADKEAGSGERSGGEPDDDDAGSGAGSAEEGEDETWARPEAKAAAGSASQPGDVGPPEPPQVRLPNFKDISVLEITSLAGVAGLLLAAFLAFAFMWKGKDPAGGKTDAAAVRLKKSVDGKWMSLDALETYWKEPGPNERVRSNRELVPEVLVRLGTATLSETAYLKTVFRDEEGTIMGDVTSHRVTNGNFADTGTPEIRIFSTDGFADEIEFVRYASGDRDPWTVEIFEGPSRAGSEWSRLAFVKVEAKRRDAATSGN